MPSLSSSHGKARRPAQAVTSARRSVEQDRNRRMWQYLTAMLIRTAAFPVTVWAFLTERFVIAGIAVALAVFIPAFAVMVANAVDTRQGPASSPRSPTRGLAAGSSAPESPRPGSPTSGQPGSGADVISGTVISGRRATPDQPSAESGNGARS